MTIDKVVYPCIFAMLLVVLASSTHAQVIGSRTTTNGSRSNNIVTAVPFLLITPDARTGSMGDAGAATLPDINAMSVNPSKLAFVEQPGGLALSYSPWLKSLVPDVNLAYLSGFYRLNTKNTIAASLRYFSLGQLQLTDINGNDQGIYNPSEMAIDFSFSRKFGENFSVGTALRYIYSDLSSGQFVAGQETKAGTALSMDVSAFMQQPTILFGSDAIFSLGTNISNIGNKVNYVKGGKLSFLPTNWKLGGATTFFPDDYSRLSFALDFNKLLVPTQPIYDSNGRIIKGKDPNRSVPSGIFGSFSDAPGGFSEELSEISVAFGVEYWYNQQFALRTGYFYESPQKGNRRYLTTGIGLKYNVFNLDFSYLIANPQKSALANTLRFSILFNFGNPGSAQVAPN